MRPRKYGELVLPFMLMVLVFLGGCGVRPAAETPASAALMRAFKANNMEIIVPIKPQRIITLFSTSPLLLEGAPVVGALSDERDVIPNSVVEKCDSLPKAGSRSDPDCEAIAELKPDLIIFISGVPTAVFAALNIDGLQGIALTVDAGYTLNSDWEKSLALSQSRKTAVSRPSQSGKARTLGSLS